MSRRRHRDSCPQGGACPATMDELSKVAALLTQGYLRLTQEARNDAVFQDGEPRKGLDVWAVESPHCVQETP